jgi:hypothetical protein
MTSQKQGDWWSRNWKWVVPAGAAGFVVVVAAFAIAIVSVVFGTMKKSAVVTESLAMARSSTELESELGSPIEPGWYMTGSISVSGGSGEADIMVPIAGPHNKAKLYVIAEKSAGRWEFELVEAQVADTYTRIDLLND